MGKAQEACDEVGCTGPGTTAAAQFSFCNFSGHQVVGGNEETMLR